MKIMNSLVGYIIHQLLFLCLISIILYFFCGNLIIPKNSSFFLGSYLVFQAIYYNLYCINFEIGDHDIKFDKTILLKKEQIISFTNIDAIYFMEINFFIVELKYVKVLLKNKTFQKFYCNSVISENLNDSDSTVSFYNAYEYTKSKFESTFFVEW
jgi:hypothetical protein